jgi:hypothetical protein
MKTSAKPLFILLLVFSLLIIPGQTLLSEDTDEAENTFVDLDGDGFDDNIADDDNDGIPNTAEGSDIEKTCDDTIESGNVSMIASLEIASDFNIDQLLSNSERFGKLKFSTRSQSCFRGGFDAGSNFGPSNGTGFTSVSVCAGGICR